MGYFDDAENVEAYIKMAEGYDGRELITVLRKYLDPGATVLELGMGPGKDLDLLREHFRVTGSDSSQAFVNRYRQAHPDADLLQLDAAVLDTERHFDAIYSNKVLHHLTKPELKASFQKQAQLLNAGGIVLHSFWYGDKEEAFSGLRFVYYTEHTLSEMLRDAYETLELQRYTEMETDDSFYIVLRRQDDT